MYVRSTTVMGNPRTLDDGIRYLHDELWPAVQAMDGCLGLSMMCDRDSGRCIATTAWTDEEAMHQSESGLFDMRMRYAEMLGGRPEVQEWEVAVMHRLRHAPEGPFCRVIWSRTDPADAERAMDTFRMALLPRMEELPGFCSVSMLVDRESGRAVSSTRYETRDAMNRAVGMATTMREDFARQMGSQITEVAEFELVLAHLRLPELV